MVGGLSGSSELSSTEILVEGSDLWTLASSLPRSMRELKTVSVDNSILTFGEFKNKMLGQLMPFGY